MPRAQNEPPPVPALTLDERRLKLVCGLLAWAHGLTALLVSAAALAIEMRVIGAPAPLVRAVGPFWAGAGATGLLTAAALLGVAARDPRTAGPALSALVLAKALGGGLFAVLALATGRPELVAVAGGEGAVLLTVHVLRGRARRSRPRAAAAPPLAFLSRRERRSLVALCRALAPAGLRAHVDALDLATAERVEQALAHAPAPLRADARRALRRLALRARLAPPFRALSRLRPPAVVRLVERTLTARRPAPRRAVRHLAAAVTTAHFSHPAVVELLGYPCDPPPADAAGAPEAGPRAAAPRPALAMEVPRAP